MAFKTKQRAKFYIETWKKRGYDNDIPDFVPSPLWEENLAPSYQAIAVAILKNDLHLSSLGFGRPQSEWYGAIKRLELKK